MWIVLLAAGCGADAVQPNATAAPQESSEDAAARLYAHEAARRRIEWVRIDTVEVWLNGTRLPAEPADADVASYIETHRDALEREYQLSRHIYTDLPPQVRLRAIVIRVPEGQPDALPAAHRRADALVERARAGEDFAALAREHSEEPVTAHRGGDMGWLPDGRPLHDLARAALALRRDGDISAVVQPRVGVFVIQRIARREGTVPLEAALPDIAWNALREERALTRAADLAEEVAAGLRDGRSPSEVAPPSRFRTLDPLATGDVVMRRADDPPLALSADQVARAFETDSPSPIVLGPEIEEHSVLVLRVTALPADPNGLTSAVRACLRERGSRNCEEDSCRGCLLPAEPSPSDLAPGPIP